MSGSEFILLLGITAVFAAVFFTCEKLYDGDYALRGLLIYIFGLCAAASGFFLLYAANLGIISALGFLDYPISRVLDFGSNWSTATKAALWLTIFEPIAAYAIKLHLDKAGRHP